MAEFTATRTVLRAAAGSHPGLQRDHNEDRCHADVERGIFMVIDGVGGHAAGDKAADIALSILRARLERETGTVEERIREAITLANNEIYEAARADPRATGMACVLTVAVVRDGRAVVGHVGDSRLYKLRDGIITKVTRDHSPVGEREDRGELTESEAMRHPRRNEIYRDVGSAPHEPEDEGFVDIVDVSLEPESALLICSDGLSDLVPSARIASLVASAAGNPALVVELLLQAAIDAGGKDNVSAVFVEGERFGALATSAGRFDPAAGRHGGVSNVGINRRVLGSRAVLLVAGFLLGAALLLALLAWTRPVPLYVRELLPAGVWPRTWVVSQDGTGDSTSIREALDRARTGDTIRVEPGEYAEHLVLTGSLTLQSTVPRGAIIVPPPDLAPHAALVEMQDGATRFSGFRIAGDAGRPLDVGMLLHRATGEADNLEISGTRVAAIEIEGRSQPVVRGSYVHDNAGEGIRVGAGAAPNLLQNVIADNGRQSEPPKPAMEVHESARPRLFGNIVMNNGVDAVQGLAPALRDEISRDNIVGRPAPDRKPATPAGRGRGATGRGQ